MPPIPAFETGLWNAWIFMLYLFLPMLVLMLMRKGATKRGKPVPPSKIEKKITPFIWIVWFHALIYSIFLPLKLGTIWFYTGLPIYLLGLILHTIAWANVATSPFDKPVTKGLYRYSRHPMYVTFPLIFIGTSIASASWLFLLLSIVLIITHFYNGTIEERECLKVHGKAYREYMKKTPKWIGIPKS